VTALASDTIPRPLLLSPFTLATLDRIANGVDDMGERIRTLGLAVRAVIASTRHAAGSGEEWVPPSEASAARETLSDIKEVAADALAEISTYAASAHRDLLELMALLPHAPMPPPPAPPQAGAGLLESAGFFSATGAWLSNLCEQAQAIPGIDHLPPD
jgi:hypothetical protein